MANAPTIIIDTREQLSYEFPGFETVRTALPTGDYSLLGYEHKVAIERKSLPDAYGCCGTNRRRFVRCLGRLSRLHRSAIVIEADLAGFCHPPEYTKLNAAQAVGSYVSWCAQFGIPIFWCGNRAYAERVTIRFLMAYWDHHIIRGKKS